MICSNCQTENAEGAKFCMNCGTILVAVCPRCSFENLPQAKFCSNCGHQLGEPVESVEASTEPAVDEPSSMLSRFLPRELAAKMEAARRGRAMEGERRIVTMMFCDIKGSTAAAEQLDPEEWAEIMNGAFEYMIRPVYRYEGTVARLMGDSILAFFGAPIAHEDDPQRAVLAGLDILSGIKPYRREIQARYGLDINVRVGINTGLVVVGAVGSDLRMEYTALGDAINLAARMEQTATPGTIQVAEETYKLVAPLFEFEDLGGIEVKGKEKPVRSFRVLRPKDQPGRLRGIQGLDSPLVGRDSEMHTLRGAVIELRQGRGQIISIMGEAGLGKSRLVAELQASPTPISGGNAKLRWLEGRSLSYETATPYAPFLSLFSRCFDLDGGHLDAQKYASIKSQVAEMVPDGTETIAPFLAALMEIEIPGEDNERVKFQEPPQLRSAIFQAVGAYFESLAVSQPLVLVFDDVHWIDATSLELLESLLPLTDRVPLMILALFRPRRNEPSWKFHETASRDYGHRYKTINLAPLGESSAEELVQNLLHIDDLPRRVRNLILAKSEGNPFFMEEVIRSMLDMGLIVRQNGHWKATQEIENIAVPDTLASVITTRLDRLEDEPRQVLQTASIIGREFPYDILASTHEIHQPLDRSLLELQRRELISEKSRLPQRSYMFKHALTQETAYATLLLKKRRALHKRVAEYLAGARPDRVGEIARHFLEAREPQLALPYLIDAGDHAAHAYATPEAIAFYEKALKILETNGSLPLAQRAYEGLGNTLTFANEFASAMETYQTMLDLAEKANDIPMQVSALNKMSFLAAMRLGDFEGAERHLSEADHRARQFQDKAGLSEMSMIRCMMCTAAADFDGVIHYMDEMVELGKELDVKEQMALGLAHISASQAYLLHFEEAWKNAQEGLKLAREIGDREHESEILVGAITLYHFYRGDLDAALKAAVEGRDIARTIGSAFSDFSGAKSIGAIAYLRGDYQEAIRSFEYYLELTRKVGAPWAEADALCLLGTVYLDISPSLLERVVEYHNQAIKIMEHPAGSMLGGSAWAELGFCMYAVGKFQEAAGFFLKGLTVPTILSNLERPRLLVGAAKLALTQNNLPEAERLLEEARYFVDEKGLKCHDPIVTLAQASLSEAQGKDEEALAHLRRLEEIAQDMEMAPILWQARTQSVKMMNRLGRQSEAEVLREKALVTIDKMGKQFEDENLRKAFLENAMEKLI